MATGLEMYDALVRAITARGNGTIAVNEFDAEDLAKLTAADLRLRGIEAARAERVANELAGGKLVELGDVVGAHLIIDERQPNLILGEGIRRSAGSLSDEEQTMEEMFEELDRIPS